jgi:cysteinyl-tRNA synthetase
VKVSRLLVMLACLVPLAGCQTPQAALDEANNTAALAASLDAELGEFRRVQAVIAQGRLDSIRTQRAMLAQYEADAAFDEQLIKAAGKTAVIQLYTTLKELSDSRSKGEADAKAKLAELDVMLAKLLTPLPETGKGIKNAQQALAALGTELSRQEQMKMSLELIREVRKTIDENKKKIDEAEASTPTPSAQPGPT